MSWENAITCRGTSQDGRRSTELNVRQPSHCEVGALASPVGGGDDRADPGQELGVAEDLARKHERPVVRDGEIPRERPTLTPELHLCPHPLPEVAGGVSGRSHGDAAAHELRIGETELLHDERSHREADYDDRRPAGRSDETRTIGPV